MDKLLLFEFESVLEPAQARIVYRQDGEYSIHAMLSNPYSNEARMYMLYQMATQLHVNGVGYLAPRIDSCLPDPGCLQDLIRRTTDAQLRWFGPLVLVADRYWIDDTEFYKTYLYPPCGHQRFLSISKYFALPPDDELRQICAHHDTLPCTICHPELVDEAG